jgi:hypothetical protein
MTLIVISTLIGSLFLGWLAWVILVRSDPALEADVQSFRVISDEKAEIQIEYRFHADVKTGSCRFEATASDHTPVGDITLSVAQIRHANGGWIAFKTLARATTVANVSCTEG